MHCPQHRFKFHIKTLQKAHLALTALTVFTIVMLINFTPSSDLYPPPPGLRKTYVAFALERTGRIGNLMFNYATVVGVSCLYNMTPLIPKDLRLFDIFNISTAVTVRSSDLNKFLDVHTRFEDFAQRASAYDPQILHLNPRISVKMFGYFQSWKYFLHASEIVKKEFMFLSHIKKTADVFLEQLPSDVVKVGIHIRRGDHLLEHFKNYGYVTPDLSYYKNAMKYFKDRFKSVFFVACSDDISWARLNIVGPDVTYCSEKNAPEEDLAILASCGHSIISVGSFGWWAAWLANGTTLYYKNWPRSSSKLEYMVNKKDYFPPHWIPMT